jgi:hypothetical protein
MLAELQGNLAIPKTALSQWKMAVSDNHYAIPDRRDRVVMVAEDEFGLQSRSAAKNLFRPHRTCGCLITSRHL